MDPQTTKLHKREKSDHSILLQSIIFLFIFNRRLLNIDEKIWSVTTVEKMKAMYNNYEQDTAVNEYVSPIERKEEDEFVEAVLATPVMRLVNAVIESAELLTD